MKTVNKGGKIIPEWVLVCRNCGFEIKSVQQGPTRGRKCPKCFVWHDKSYLK